MCDGEHDSTCWDANAIEMVIWGRLYDSVERVKKPVLCDDHKLLAPIEFGSERRSRIFSDATAGNAEDTYCFAWRQSDVKDAHCLMHQWLFWKMSICLFPQKIVLGRTWVRTNPMLCSYLQLWRIDLEPKNSGSSANSRRFTDILNLWV